MIIGLLAQKRNGKDTVADHLIARYGYRRYGFADPIKMSARELFDLSDEQLYGDLKEVVDERWGVTPRQILQVLGTELSQFDLPRHLPAMAEKIGDNGRAIWVYRFKIEAAKFVGANIVLSDVRFHHEVKAIQEMGGQIWKIVRPGFENDSDHPSEREIQTAKYDRLIMNDGSIEDLYEKVDLTLDGELCG
jgi:hypothetical protein